MLSLPLVIILICIFLSALFSGLEIAFLSSDKFLVELRKKQGSFAASIISNFHQFPSKFIITMLVGNNITIVVYGIFMALLVEPQLRIWFSFMGDPDAAVILAQTIISTIVVLIFAEFLPKSLFLINPNSLLFLFSAPLLGVYYLFKPLVWGINALSRLFIKSILKLDYQEDKPVFGLTDLNNFLKRHLNSPTPQQNIELSTMIFNNALEFKKIRVRECMVPRPDIVAVDLEDGMDELRKAFIESGHTKILIFRESIDNIIGYCHALEIFKKPKTIEDIITPLLITPESMLANELLVKFIEDRKSIALVVDEFGGTAGIVTIEDVIEQILGEIQDEHDTEDWVEEQIDDQTFVLSARHEIDYLNEKYKWNIPTGDYETLGGFILSITENIPNLGEVIERHPFVFTIISMQDARIDTVRLTISDMESFQNYR